MHLLALSLFPGGRVVTELPGFEPLRALANLYADRTELVVRRHRDGFAFPHRDLERPSPATDRPMSSCVSRTTPPAPCSGPRSSWTSPAGSRMRAAS